MVIVSGYTRADGTKVSSYVRAAPSTSTSRSGSSSKSTVRVNGYTRCDGIRVSGYTRAAPGTSNSRSSSGTKVHASGGTEYEKAASWYGYTSCEADLGYYEVNPGLGRTTEPLQSTIHSLVPKFYVDKPLPVPRPMQSTPNPKFYVDNPYNRKFGRVGKPLGTCTCENTSKRGKRHQQLLEENTLDNLVKAMERINMQQPCNHPSGSGYESIDYQYAIDQLQRNEVEESWRENSLEPSEVDVSSLGHGYFGVLIPLTDLKLEKIIGRGGFGEVYAGRLFDKPVAFKKLLYQRMSQKRKDDFIREVTILVTIDHPNVIKMVGVVVEENNIGIVMEYLKCSLYRAMFIDCTLQEVGKKMEIIKQVTSALKYLHRQREIAHCDIKSENILLDWDDNAKLCDFGLSALKNETASSQSNFAGLVPPGQGTPRYSAPEVLRGEVLNMTQLLQADVYSLAIVVFEVMAGEEPFPGLNVAQLQTNVGRGDMRPPTSMLSNPIRDLLTKCWAKDGTVRPTALEFQAAWDDIITTPITPK